MIMCHILFATSNCYHSFTYSSCLVLSDEFDFSIMVIVIIASQYCSDDLKLGHTVWVAPGARDHNSQHVAKGLSRLDPTGIFV